jgi:hypothetical protein
VAIVQSRPSPTRVKVLCLERIEAGSTVCFSTTVAKPLINQAKGECTTKGRLVAFLRAAPKAGKIGGNVCTLTHRESKEEDSLSDRAFDTNSKN